jgi:hypothetical protein
MCYVVLTCICSPFSEYFGNDTQASDAHFNWLFEHAESMSEKVEAYLPKLQLTFTAGRHSEAFQIGVECCACLGVATSLQPTESELAAVLSEFESIFFQVQMAPKVAAAAPPAQNEEELLAQRYLAEFVGMAYFHSMQFYGLVAARASLMALQCGGGGANEYGAVAMGHLAWVYAMRNAPQLAVAVSSFALTIIERSRDVACRGRFYLVYAAHTHFLQRHCMDSAPLLRSALQCLLTCYARVTAGFAAALSAELHLVANPSVDDALIECRSLLALQRHLNAVDMANVVEVVISHLQSLQLGATATDWFSQPEWLQLEQRVRLFLLLFARALPSHKPLVDCCSGCARPTLLSLHVQVSGAI